MYVKVVRKKQKKKIKKKSTERINSRQDQIPILLMLKIKQIALEEK